MTPKKIVVSHWVHQEVLDYLKQHGEVVPNETKESLEPAELINRCRDADALLAFMPDRIDATFLDNCPKLKIVAGAFKGHDNVDVEECAKRKIAVTVVPDLLTAPTAELAVGLALALLRKILQGDQLVRSGQFKGWRPILYGGTLENARVGILGYGRLGKAIARRVEGFGSIIKYHDPIEGGVSFEELLKDSDVLFVSAPLTSQSRHLIDRQALARLPAGAILINVGRGSVVDEEAVAEVLSGGRVSGYAADVFEMEDLSCSPRPDHIPQALLAMRDRTFFTPHLGSAVERVRLKISLSAAQAMVESLAGHRPHSVVTL